MFSARFGFGLEEGAPAMEVRRRVFVEERGVPAMEEFDDFDAIAAHLLVWDEEKAQPIAAGRMYPLHGDICIGNIAVTPAYRGQMFDDLALRALLNRVDGLPGARVLFSADAHEQLMLRPFGFTEAGETSFSRGAQRKTMAVDRDKILWDSPCKHSKAPDKKA